MVAQMTTINELSVAAGELSRFMNMRSGLNPHSPIIFALASGLDIAIAVFEQSTGARVSSFSREAATRVVQYFHEEAKRSESVDPQISIFYLAWAQALTSKFLDTVPSST
jgi:hypothetical protein